MFYTKYLKKRYYRVIESLIKKILIYKNINLNICFDHSVVSGSGKWNRTTDLRLMSPAL